MAGHVIPSVLSNCFERRGKEEGGRKREKGKEGNERKQKEAVWQPVVNMFHHSIQCENIDQSAALFTQQLASKILPQFVQNGVMCEQNHGCGDLRSESNQIFFSFLLP